MKSFFAGLVLVCFYSAVYGQSNIHSTNPVCLDILKGNYDPEDYKPPFEITDPHFIANQIQDQISPDSLQAYLLKLSTFENRNTGSDTLSTTTGIGAARNWVYSKFEEFSEESQDRLIPSFLYFERDICGMDKHKNIFAVLPGNTLEKEGVIIIEAHVDSRCESACDIECQAHGMEDNGSGTALVLELARVMSKFSFARTIVFMATIGEEQGLYGADAFADWAVQQNIPIKAVLNNDVIGGIICGETSSPPSCPGLNNIDSTQVRLFSAGSWNSPHKGLARYIKLQYQEELLPLVSVPMTISIMAGEDRIGRGGDHIPFRQKGFPAMRFTSANEHGDAGIDPDYHDRQHTIKDILGVDTDGDMVIDSFFVDFNYLKRNTCINGVAATMLTYGPPMPAFSIERVDTDIHVVIEDSLDLNHYRLGVRSLTHDFDTIYTIIGSKEATFPNPSPEQLYFSVASVEESGVESCFTEEQYLAAVSTENITTFHPEKTAFLLNNRPNPFDESTIISFMVNELPSYTRASVEIFMPSGERLASLPCELKEGINEVLYEHGYGTTGKMFYSLVIDSIIIDTKAMIFAN